MQQEDSHKASLSNMVVRLPRAMQGRQPASLGKGLPASLPDLKMASPFSKSRRAEIFLGESDRGPCSSPNSARKQVRNSHDVR